MTSNESYLRDGDRQPNVDAFETSYYKDSHWTNLPVPVFKKLCSKLSGEFVHVARQVCHSWLNTIDNLIGLNVKIDDSVPGNIEFARSVKIALARIVNWRINLEDQQQLFSESKLLFQFPSCLKKLTICGKMPDHWRIRYVREFPNLAHLVIRGAALHINDLTDFPFPEPNQELSSQDRLLIYQQYEPPILPRPIYLKNLKKLEMIMNEFSYPPALPISVRINEPERAIQHEIILQRLYFVVINNVTFILNNLRCPQLSTVQFYIYPKAGIVLPSKMNWKNLPLQRFLENHHNSLRQLFLPDFEGISENTSNEDLPRYPTKLTKLHTYLSNFIGDREEAREQNTTYWRRFLMGQTHLEDIFLQFSYLSGMWLEDALTSMSLSSKDTLRYIDIAVQSEETVQINLEMFSFCHNLSILKISGRDNDTLLKNIQELPVSLVKLYITTSIVEPPEDPNCVLKYTKLEMLVIKTIVVEDHQLTPAKTVIMVRNLFRLRKLNLLMLTFDAPLNSNRVLISILKKLDGSIDILYPIFTVKFNLPYEYDEGWGEETFDEEKLDIEYISMREPEDYSTWYSRRHRNAISVDDEDHRIFIFQTLPFLLDVGFGGGGRRRAAGARQLVENDDEGIVDDDDDTVDDDDDTDSDESTIAVDSDADDLASDF